MRIGLGFVGVGLRGRGQSLRAASDFADRARVVAMADLDESTLSAAREALSHVPVETSTRWEDLLARDDVDAVCISTPQFTHREIAVALAAERSMETGEPVAIADL